MNNNKHRRYFDSRVSLANCRTSVASLLMVAVLASLPANDTWAKTHRSAPARSSRATQAKAVRGQTQALNMKKTKTSLPQAQLFKSAAPARSLNVVKPPRSSDFYDDNSKEAEYEKLVDQEIEALYKLTKQHRRSKNRGEFWLRLGERYVEKARLVDFRQQAEFDEQLKAYQSKKSRMKPRIDTSLRDEYHKKAIELYRWFIKDFPNDAKVDQALFFLGYNYFEIGKTTVGESFYKELLRRYPDSAYVTESYFALGEFYFENSKWQEALDAYSRVIRVKQARLNSFAMFKAAWCLYRQNRIQTALLYLERVAKLSRLAQRQQAIEGRKSVNKIRLGSEALKDYVPFYAEIGDPKQAAKVFDRVSGGDEGQVLKMLERLAYIYSDTGNRFSANFIFKQLISMNYENEKSADYQYQVVLAFATSDQKEFRRELEIWLDSFGPESLWAKKNRQNEKLVTDIARLQESTLRNHVLQLHKAAQDSRAEYTQKLAATAYRQYFKYFPETSNTTEMLFFYAELLFDLNQNVEAAKNYAQVADRDPNGPYRERAITNTLLALERELPSSDEVDRRRGDRLDPLPLDISVQRFEAAAKRYITVYPNGSKVADIQRKLGFIYYSFNHFPEAIDIFQQIVKRDPRSENAEVAGNLILDIYKLRDDMAGFTEKGRELLAIPEIAQSKFGAKVRTMMESATFLRADRLATSGELARSAKEFEDFAASFARSPLLAAARYKAAINYEKVGDLSSAIRMYNVLLITPTNDQKMKNLKVETHNSLAKLYQQTGQLEKAAKSYHTFAVVKGKSPEAVNAYYNSGVLWEGLADTEETEKNYSAYLKLSRGSDKYEVIYRLGELYYQRGQWFQASQQYQLYLNSVQLNPKTEAQVVKSAFMVGKISERKGQSDRARLWYQKAIGFYKSNRATGKHRHADLMAEAEFYLAQPLLQQLANVKFTNNDAQQARAATLVQKLKEQYISKMKDVIRYDDGNSIVAALASTGQMFEQIARTFDKIPAPQGLTGEDAKKYRELVLVQVKGFQTEALKSYKTAVEKSQALETYTPWTKVARLGLAQLDPMSAGYGAEVISSGMIFDGMGL